MKKPVLATQKNLALIEEYLSLQMGQAKAHTFTANEILSLASVAEKRLESLKLTKSEMVGVEVSFRSGTPTGKAYRRAARTCLCTFVTMQRRASGWFVTSIEKVQSFAGTNPTPRYVIKSQTLNKGIERLLLDIIKTD
jgi:hypothetical protein